MNAETVLITIGCLGVTGSLVAIAMGYAVHLNEERDRQWWADRNVDFSEPEQTNATRGCSRVKTSGSELSSACAAGEVTSGGMVSSVENKNQEDHEQRLI